MQIAIDTSTGTASLALVKDGAMLAELTWRCGQDHTVHLLPNLAHLLRQAGVTLESANCIIVAKGPGSYNGLRVGLSTAKGLAFSLDIPLIGISTLEAEAYQYAGDGLPVCVIQNAGRGEIAAAIYQEKGSQWFQTAAEHITTAKALCEQVKDRTIFCGEVTAALAGYIKETVEENAVIISSISHWRRAGYLAELGLRRFQAGDFDNPATLQPLYLRAPAITQAKHR
ncbi:MAG: tRNA (adenosine(37)-N6)-threonylcarbamoyltransferase complex dimerization subunit type 1 TsaB [Chloroflexi bacterium]|nr:tRNA (adenosine(37)-N6)-threonylcarbamoyltransferase complex dimerization subunit type 1 TsaB [Chloroflexota bacterium]